MSRAVSNPLDVLKQLIDGEKDGPVKLEHSVLCKITENFSREQIIGSGAHGEVYMGKLRYKPVVAVKKLIGDKDNFKDEAMNMMKIPKHPNVVRFLGYCFYAHEEIIKITIHQRIQRFLCFEYISNGSLEKHITRKDELRGLEWHKRFRIIKGICEGVQHLHSNDLIHRDLKPQNILLDQQMVPKIADFGISMLSGSLIATTSFIGTIAYCDPDDHKNGKHVDYSFASDIYSLGIIITEVVTGIREEPKIMDVLKRWKHRWSKSKDHTRLSYQQVNRCLELAKECKKKWQNRPKIDEILRKLREVDNDDDEYSSSAAEKIYPNEKDISGLKDMLGIHPLELHFPFEHGKDMISTVVLTNGTDDYIAFRVWCNVLGDLEVGVIRPGSKHDVTITLKATPGDSRVYEKTPPCVIIDSTRVSKEELDLLLGDKDALQSMFKEAEESGREVDEVRLYAFFDKPKAESNNRQNEMAAGEPTTEEPAEPFSQPLLLVHPSELRYPLLLLDDEQKKQKKVPVPLWLTNMTDKKVAFMFTSHSQVMNYDSSVHGNKGILAPRSKWGLVLSMEPREDAPQIIDEPIKDKLVIRSAPLDDLEDECLETEDINQGLFDKGPDAHDLELEVVFVQQDSHVLHLTTTTASASMGPAGSATTLMSFDAIGMDGLLEVFPLELRFPFEPRKPISCTISLTNKTSKDVQIEIVIPRNRERYGGIKIPSCISPHSTIGVEVTMKAREHKPSNKMDEFRIYMSNDESLFGAVISGWNSPGIIGISLMAVLCEPDIAKHEDIDMDDHFGAVKAIDVHPTKPLVLTYHDSKYLCIWMTYEQHEGPCKKLLSRKKFKWASMSPKFIPRTQWIVVFTSHQQRVYIYNDKLEQANKLKAHDDIIRLAAVHPTDSYLVTATSVNEIKLWNIDKDTADCHPIRVFKEQRLRQVIFDPRGSNTFATVSDARSHSGSRTIKIWSIIDSASPTSQRIDVASDDDVVYCSTESEQQYIVLCCDSFEPKILHHPQKTGVHRLEDNISICPPSYTLHPTLPFLVRCGSEGVSIWNYNIDRLMQVLKPWNSYKPEYAGLMEVEGNKRLVVGSDGGIKILDINWTSLSG